MSLELLIIIGVALVLITLLLVLLYLGVKFANTFADVFAEL